MATLVLTITETLRYRGKIGQLSWALHRIAGLGTLLFLFLHVIDTSWAALYPNLYEGAIKVYQNPVFTVGEFALVACVIYHALNGFRIVLFDVRPKWWHRQAQAAQIVLILTIVLLVPTFFLMFGHVLNHYQEPGVVFQLNLDQVISEQAPFVAGIVALVVGGIVVSALYSIVPGANSPKKGKTSQYDRFMWSFMRVSGVIILPLVFGHLAMMHVIQGVFDITAAGVTPVGTLAANQTGTAVEFVSLRWNTVVAGVFVWRVYDICLLALAVIHGLNGLRYVINDYAHNLIVNRGMNIAVLATAIGLIIVGSLAILNAIPLDAARVTHQVAGVLH